MLTLIDTPSDKAPNGARGHRVILTREADNDAMTVKFEPVKSVAKERWAEVAQRLSEKIQQALHVRLKCEPVAPETLPRYELKTKRIIDQRPKEFRRALDR